MATLTISLAQMHVQSGSVRRNMNLMQSMVEEAVRRGSQLVVLPELFSCGYGIPKDELEDLASPLNSGEFAQVSSLAKQHKVCIIGSQPESRGIGVNNSAAFFAPNGQVMGVYRKIHLFSPMGEDQAFKAGQSPLNMDLPWGKTGVAICYDLRFPEMFRRYAVEGTKMVLMPAAWPSLRIEHWRTLLKARAIENQCFMVACNTTGKTTVGDTETMFGGHSMIVDPWGETVIEAGTAPGLYTVEIDLDVVEETRRKLPVLDDRQPSAYGLDDIMSQLNL